MVETESTILVVEDDERARQLLELHLRPLGFRVEFAEDGRAGLQRARDLEPDIILSDVMMPELTGFDLCRELRADVRLKEVPILLITALDDHDSRLEGIEAGADEFLSKPIDGDELRARIRLISKLNRYRRLQAEQAKFYRVVDLAPNAIFILNPRLEIEFANRSAVELFGGGRNLPLEGTRFPFLIDELPHAKFDEDLFQHVAEISRPVHFSGTFIRLDNTRFPAEGAAGPFVWDGTPAMQVNLSDVSDTRKLEHDLLRSQRLHGLGSIAGGIAHDLNNVLTPILLAADRLADSSTDPKIRHLVSAITNAGGRGAALVQQVLTFARGRQDELISVSMKQVIAESRRLLSESLPNNVRLKIWPLNGDLNVLGNPTELVQVLMNLCVNARDAIPDGGTIEIRCVGELDDAGERRICLSVSDTGVGMAPDTVAQIGDSFFTTKASGKGTGLGLSTVCTIVKRHAAKMEIETVPNEGTTFFIRFLAAERESVPEMEADDFVRVQGNGEVILICDDNAAVREIAAEAISCHGFEVLGVGNGAEATALFSQHADRIAVVLTDLSMPYLDGLGVTRAVRRMGGKVPVVVMTTQPTDDQRAEIDREGAALLAKPFTTTELLSAVAMAVKNATVPSDA